MSLKGPTRDMVSPRATYIRACSLVVVESVVQIRQSSSDVELV